ncbi:MAG: matrixin family metalloprotease [Dehalococcoidia bacterium]
MHSSRPRAAASAVLIALPLLLLLLSTACIEVRRSVDVSVTPGTVPEEIRGARWQELPVTYCIAAGASPEEGFVEPARLEELVADAFARWGMEVQGEGECNGPAERGNGRNEVTWDSRGRGADGEGGVFEAGFTRQLFRSCPGGCEGGAQSRLVEADILLTPAPPDRFRNEACLFATLLHETGHFLGVPHLASPAVMAPAASECPDALTDADRSALAELYGRGAP